MARTDELMKNLFKHKEIFADLFNATIFNGQQLIKPEIINDKKGDFRMGKNAIQEIYDDGKNEGIMEGDTLRLILLITKKIQKGKT